jgi:hypothetical protein
VFVRPRNTTGRSVLRQKLACCYATVEQWSRFNSSGPGPYKSSVPVIFILFNWPASVEGGTPRTSRLQRKTHSSERNGRFVGRWSPLSRCIDPAGFIQSPNRSGEKKRTSRTVFGLVSSLSLLPPTAAHGRGFFVCRTASGLYRIQRPTCSRFSLL